MPKDARMSEGRADYEVLGREGERLPVNGLWRNVGDTIPLTAEEAEYYLREGTIAPAKGKRQAAKPADAAPQA